MAMFKTTAPITMEFGKGGIKVPITIPAGTRCSETGDGQFFVEDLSWLDRNSMTWHDANYYGIRLNTDQVRPASGVTVGTSHFVSKAAAVRYYAYEHATEADIDRKLAEGLIHIGKPELKPGQRLSTIDNGTRYAIED
jgi:hypothetical protein